MNWLLIIVLVEGVLLIIVGAGWIHNAMKDHSAYWKMETERDEARTQRDKINTERDILSRECRKSEDAIAYYVGELQQCQIERDKWSKLYNELLTTYHALQGDAHATAPLQEVSPLVAPATRTRPARTRKKAETQQ